MILPPYTFLDTLVPPRRLHYVGPPLSLPKRSSQEILTRTFLFPLNLSPFHNPVRQGSFSRPHGSKLPKPHYVSYWTVLGRPKTPYPRTPSPPFPYSTPTSQFRSGLVHTGGCGPISSSLEQT